MITCVDNTIQSYNPLYNHLGPIYIYSLVFSWSQLLEYIISIFSEHAIPIRPTKFSEVVGGDGGEGGSHLDLLGSLRVHLDLLGIT